jgi:hypothetical protein
VIKICEKTKKEIMIECELSTYRQKRTGTTLAKSKKIRVNQSKN